MKTIRLASAVMELKETVISLIRRGAVFVYPTDTVYGLGCNAENGASVMKIRAMKGAQHPFSVIAPSVGWIQENFVIKHPDYLKKLPGPCTLILEKKKPMLSEASETGTLGIRIPSHPFAKVIQEAGVPFITTSANVSGQETIKQVSDIPESIAGFINVAIDAGVLDGAPSAVFDLTGEEPERIR